MSSINRPEKIYTHEGAVACQISPLETLKRTVMCAMLWEKNFYESGKSIAARVELLVQDCMEKHHITDVLNIAQDARHRMHIRHMPLFIVAECCKHKKSLNDNLYMALALTPLITRPDDLTEFLALYWRKGKCPLCVGVKKGLAEAFNNFDEYQFAKYNRNTPIKLRDVMFLVHPKPKNEEQAAIFKKLANNTLNTPDTWEVNLSAKGADKKAVWTRLLLENKLGDLAFLRNLRNMQQVGVDLDLIKSKMHRSYKKMNPFNFIISANNNPMLEAEIETAMLSTLKEHQKLLNDTVILIDVSGSMKYRLSFKSDLTCMDAACGLAILLREIAATPIIMSFSAGLKLVPNRSGFALKDAIINSQPHLCTYVGEAIRSIEMHDSINPHRIIIITDEQTHDEVPSCPSKFGYIVNVSTNAHGVGYGNGWTHINGWSMSVIDYILENEAQICSN